MTSITTADECINLEDIESELDKMRPDQPDLTVRFGDDSDEVQRHLCGVIVARLDVAKEARRIVPASAFSNNAHKTIAQTIYDRLDASGTLAGERELCLAMKEKYGESKSLPYYVAEVGACLNYAALAGGELPYWRDLLLRMAKDDALAYFLKASRDKREAHGENVAKYVKRLSEIDAVAGGAKPLFRRWSQLREIALANETTWLIDGWLRLGALHLMTGDPFAGKSCVVADMIAALMHGVPWAGIQTTQCPVLLCDLENGDAIIFKRLQRALNLLGGDGDAEALLLQLDAAAVGGAVGKEQLERFVNEAGRVFGDESAKGIIVIDTLRSSQAADPDFNENDNSILSAKLKPMRAFAAASGWGVLVLHHNNRMGTYAGGNALPSNADIMLAWQSNKATGQGRLEMLGTTDDHQSPLVFMFDRDLKVNVFCGNSAEVRRAETIRWLTLIPESQEEGMTRREIAAKAIEAKLITRIDDETTEAVLRGLAEDKRINREQPKGNGTPYLHWLSDGGKQLLTTTPL
jgi:hypothetical protein